LVGFFLDAIVSKMRGGYFSLSKAYVETIPVITGNNTQIESLVTRILAAKQANPQADTSMMEAEIDGLVYGVYGLGEAEIKIIEAR
jgi:adenine-specific DNA-methyltransferase